MAAFSEGWPPFSTAETPRRTMEQQKESQTRTKRRLQMTKPRGKEAQRRTMARTKTRMRRKIRIGTSQAIMKMKTNQAKTDMRKRRKKRASAIISDERPSFWLERRRLALGRATVGGADVQAPMHRGLSHAGKED